MTHVFTLQFMQVYTGWNQSTHHHKRNKPDISEIFMAEGTMGAYSTWLHRVGCRLFPFTQVPFTTAAVASHFSLTFLCPYQIFIPCSCTSPSQHSSFAFLAFSVAFEICFMKCSEIKLREIKLAPENKEEGNCLISFYAIIDLQQVIVIKIKLRLAMAGTIATFDLL